MHYSGKVMPVKRGNAKEVLMLLVKTLGLSSSEILCLRKLNSSRKMIRALESHLYKRQIT